MDWDQIESKWAAMTRRVRGDLSINKADVKGPTLRRAATSEVKAVVGADQQTSATNDLQNSMTAQ
jgi:hypothetical protein